MGLVPMQNLLQGLVPLCLPTLYAVTRRPLYATKNIRDVWSQVTDLEAVLSRSRFLMVFSSFVTLSSRIRIRQRTKLALFKMFKVSVSYKLGFWWGKYELIEARENLLSVCMYLVIKIVPTCILTTKSKPSFLDYFLSLEACELLETEAELLKQCLSLRRITTVSTGEQFMKPCSESECEERRDCMVKVIYSRYKMLSELSIRNGNRIIDRLLGSVTT